VLFSTTYPLLARLWVYVVAGTFLLIPSAMLLRRSWRSAPSEDATEAQPKPAVDWSLVSDQAVLLLFFVIFLLVTPYLGFVLATVLFVFGLTAYFERRPVLALVAGVVTGLLIFAMKTGFGFFLPTGLLDI
jgi:hypothetical protein